MTAKKSTKTVLRLATIITLVMLISSSLALQTIAAVSTNWLPTDDGLELASTTGESETAITKTSDNYYITAWADDRNTNWDIYAQKLNAEGTEQWTAGGIGIVTGTGNQPSTSEGKELTIIADQSGGAILAWVDENNSDSIYVRKIDSTGTTTWTQGPISTQSKNLHLLEDSSGGAYLAWEAKVEIPPSTGFYSQNIYTTHLVGTNGSLDWNSGQPIEIAVTDDDETAPQIVTTSDGIIITYLNKNYATPDDFYELRSTKVTTSGTISTAWSPYITTSTNSTTVIDEHRITPDGSDGVIVTYQYNSTDIKAQRINFPELAELPSMLWGANGIDIANSTGTQSEPQIISDSEDNAIIAWLDNRSGIQELYAQKVGTDGSTAWAVNGISISTETLPKFFPRLLSNGDNGAIILYVQSDIAQSRSDIKAQLLNSSGTPQWGATGTLIETDSTTIYDLYPIAASNNNGGAVITWLRETTVEGSSEIHAQYITDSEGGICLEPGSGSFCGTQTISSSTLTFTDIPDSFNFGTIQSGATNHNCTNGSNITSPAYICSTDQTPVAGADDLIKVYDDRNSGGFQVNLSPGANSFTDGTNTIPLTNLYILTSLPETPSSGFNDSGITYDATGETGISAPAYINEFTPDFVDISDPAAYTSRSAASQFGSGSIVLMDGTLSESVGRSGYFSQYINYYLKTDPNQAPGNYAIIMTYDLMDSTTI